MQNSRAAGGRGWTKLVSGAGIVALLTSLAACGGGSSSGSSGDGTGEPVAGETLTIAAAAPPNSLDPGTVDNAFTTYTLWRTSP